MKKDRQNYQTYQEEKRMFNKLQVNFPVRSIRLLAMLMLVLALAAACSTSTESTDTAAAPTAETAAEQPAVEAPAEIVEIDWWHIQNADPMMTEWQKMADEYMAAHPNVKINVTVMENEAFKSALQTNLQAGDAPDLFQSWGGGGLKQMVEGGLVRDITAESAGFIDNLNPGAAGLYQVDGKQYGIPYNLGMVGFWYNKDLFDQAGIDAPPATWSRVPG